MPKGTPVHDVYEALRREGMDEGRAARIAQAQTGLSLATGKKPKHRKADAAYVKALQAFSHPKVKVKRRRRSNGPAAMVSAGNVEVATFKSFAQVLAKDYPEYDPGQPRDEQGRWTNGGGAGGGVSAGRAPETKPHRQLAAISNNLTSISSRSEAATARTRANAVHDSMRRLPEATWRDPTALDHAWRGYLITVTSIAALAAVSVLIVGTTTGGALIAGAHTHPFRQAVGASLMAAFPKGWSSLSYTSARRFLTTLWPGEGRALRIAFSVAPMVAAGTVGLGAVLATAIALRYAYRKISTNGEYQGVSSVNRRLEILDQHINSLTSAMRGGDNLPSDATPKQRRVLPYIQSGLAIGASLVALAGAAKFGAMAYRAAKLPKMPVGATEGWPMDLGRLWRAFGSDVRTHARAARSAAARARRPRTT